MTARDSTTAVGRRDKAIVVTGLVADRIGLALLYIVFGPVVRDLGLSEMQFGVLVASANVTLGFASPWWGRQSQVLGRRPVFVIGLAGYALGFILLAVALQAGLRGWIDPLTLFVFLLAARLGYGLLAAGTQPAATAWAADVTGIERRAQGMALLGVAAAIGTLLGPVLGGSLTMIGQVVPLYVAAGLAAAASALAWGFLRETARPVAALATTATTVDIAFAGDRLRITDPRIFPFLVGWFVIVLVLTAVQAVTAFYIEDGFAVTGREDVARATSIALFAMGAAMLFVQSVLLKVLTIRPVRLVAGGFVLFGVALLILLAATGIDVVYLAFAVMGIGFGTLAPGLNAAASVSVDDREQGAVAGLLAAAPVLGMIVGPVAGTALYGIDPGWLLAPGAIACMVTGCTFLLRR